MKKVILSAVAVGALAIGGAVHADVIDSVGNTISRLFGVPYDPTPSGVALAGGVYTDASGRQFQVDAAGRYVPLGTFGSYRDRWGHTVYLGANHQPAFVAENGRLLPYGSADGTYAMAPSFDQDRDGVPNRYDRYPNDARYR